MSNFFLVFSNGEKLGDGIIKMPFLHEIKRRFPEFKIIWLANGTTVYNNKLKLFADKYIDEVIENAKLNPFFWKKVTNKKELLNLKFEYIFDTQKAVARTIALKRLKHNNFISKSANGLFSSIKIKNKNIEKKYYLDELIDLLDNVRSKNIDKFFKINIPTNIENILSKYFDPKVKYIGIAPGAGDQDRVWPLQNFIDVAKHFEKLNFKIVWFIGPNEIKIQSLIKNKFPNSIYPEELITEFSNIEVVMATTKFLICCLANDSGISHVLSTKQCSLIKLIGNKNSIKFSPNHEKIINISPNNFRHDNISNIDIKTVITKIESIIKNKND